MYTVCEAVMLLSMKTDYTIMINYNSLICIHVGTSEGNSIVETNITELP